MRRRLYQFAIIVASLFIIQGFSRSLVELWQQKQRLGKTRQDLAQLKQQEVELKKQLAYYQSDEYVEKIAREKLMLGKPGEEVILLPKQDENNPILQPADQSSPMTNVTTEDKVPNWKKWARLFDL